MGVTVKLMGLAKYIAIALNFAFLAVVYIVISMRIFRYGLPNDIGEILLLSLLAIFPVVNILVILSKHGRK